MSACGRRAPSSVCIVFLLCVGVLAPQASPFPGAQVILPTSSGDYFHGPRKVWPGHCTRHAQWLRDPWPSWRWLWSPVCSQGGLPSGHERQASPRETA